jgi:hypothetical protein
LFEIERPITFKLSEDESYLVILFLLSKFGAGKLNLTHLF